MKNATLNIVLFEDSDVIATSGLVCTNSSHAANTPHYLLKDVENGRYHGECYIKDASGNLNPNGQYSDIAADRFKTEPIVGEWYTGNFTGYYVDSSVVTQ